MMKFYKGQLIYRLLDANQMREANFWEAFHSLPPVQKIGVLEKDLEVRDSELSQIGRATSSTKAEECYFINDIDFVLVYDAKRIEASLPKADSTTQTPSKSRRNITIAIIVIVVIAIVGYLIKRNR